MKDADFIRERFFNVTLLVPYSSFISKLQTIYNNTILNYNGLSGIGKIYDSNTNESDNKYLVDNEYKYNNSQGNSSAKAIAIISASVQSIVVNVSKIFVIACLNLL